MTEKYWCNSKALGQRTECRRAMVDTKKELLLRRESEWSDRQQKNSRTHRKTYKESEVIRETETHRERI